MQIDSIRKQLLMKEIPILHREIQTLYQKLDRRFHLQGAQIPITFGYDTDQLGSYTQGRDGNKEQFHFSLLFIGRSMPHPLSQEDRLDLYKHEYAHYMQYHMEIPKQYTYSYGTHGSAWKYCCSLVGAAPTPLYKAGEGKVEHNYEKHLSRPITDKTYTLKDNYRQKVASQKQKDSRVQYQIGDTISHPTFGEGEVVHVEPQAGSVRLHIQFCAKKKIIDQKWLLKNSRQKK